MEFIKFDLEQLKKDLNGFSCYILGRSYDLEENGVTEDFSEALKYYKDGMNLKYPLCDYSIGISLILGDVLEIDIVPLIISKFPLLVIRLPVPEIV